MTCLNPRTASSRACPLALALSILLAAGSSCAPPEQASDPGPQESADEPAEHHADDDWQDEPSAEDLPSAHANQGRHRPWVDRQTLDSDQPSAGRSIALYGDTLVTGGVDLVRVYHRAGGPGSWTLVQTLTPSPGSGGAFGRGLALNGNVLIVGAGRENAFSTPYPYGHADVFRRQGNLWVFEARLQPNLGGLRVQCQESSFGKNIVLIGSLAVVSAHRMGLTSGGCGQGAAFVFRRSGTTGVRFRSSPRPTSRSRTRPPAIRTSTPTSPTRCPSPAPRW